MGMISAIPDPYEDLVLRERLAKMLLEQFMYTVTTELRRPTTYEETCLLGWNARCLAW